MNFNLTIILFLLISCGHPAEKDSKVPLQTLDESVVQKSDSTISLRYQVPENCTRLNVDSIGFGFYLRNLPIKPKDALVSYYNGGNKTPGDVYCGVVDLSLGNRDLQQCADAVMRLRAEYLFEKGKKEDIHFNFLSDGKPRYFKDHCGQNYDYPSLLKYLDYIFAFANTSSLHDELSPVSNFQEMVIGDVLIQKGSPYGHAVIVVDMCVNEQTGDKYYMLAQSYMPAQDIQILKNPESDQLSPWYKLKEGRIITPEWTFQSSDLRRF